jgi:hypothetical protein
LSARELLSSSYVKEESMWSEITTEESTTVVGTINVRIRTEEYASDESGFFCVERIDRLQTLIDTLMRGACRSTATPTRGRNRSGQFVIGRHGSFFELIVSTETS